MSPVSTYAELQITSNFTFLEGASHPQELALTAAALGLAAFAVTDRNSLAGIVRAHLAAREAGIRLVVGARLELQDGPSLLCYPSDRAAYGRLSQLLTLFITPVVYIWFDKLVGVKFGDIRFFRRKTGTQQPAE